MAEPIQYETFTQMMLDHAPFVIAGAISLIGMTMLILKKLGYLVLNKDDREKNEVCKHCSIVNGSEESSKVIDELKRQIKCDHHESLCDTVKTIRATQIKMEQQQQTNISKLNNGKDEFDKLHSRISAMNDKVTDLRIGIAVLLNKSGAKIKEFKDIKVD